MGESRDIAEKKKKKAKKGEADFSLIIMFQWSHFCNFAEKKFEKGSTFMKMALF